MSAATLWMVPNQPRIGGGEVMMLQIAEVARDLGVDVRVVAPRAPGGHDETARAATDRGFPVTALSAGDRGGFARALRRWDRSRTGVLWCHGLVPALATAGRPRRVVHLHQEPRGRTQRVALSVARLRAERVLVPSAWMTTVVAGSTTLGNWTDDLAPGKRVPGPSGPRIGFLGRTSDAKGTDVLARAVAEINKTRSPHIRLVVGGDDRFVEPGDRDGTDAALRALDGDVERQGWVRREAFFADVDVVAVPSTASESFGLVAAEAMSARVPVVVSDAGALPEVVGPEHPWVVPAGDERRLAATIVAVLDSDPAPWVAAARARWESHHSPASGRIRTRDLLASLGLLDAGSGVAR